VISADAPRLSRLALVAELRALGLRAGQVVLVHSSMRSIGWIAGGAPTVVAAIRDVIGAEGTMVVPTETTDNSDTSRTHLSLIAGLTADEIRQFRAAMPPFRVGSTPSTDMGQVAEEVRLMTGAHRSAHPQSSFAALGPVAGKLVADHQLTSHLGEWSPLARLYEVGAEILMLGVGYDMCTAFHLAEYRYQADPPRRTYRCVVEQAGEPCWVEYEDVVLDDGDFKKLGLALEATGVVVCGQVGAADSRLIPFAPAVDFAVSWMRANR
jgi:aminoglycoside 3-N-acetyltransferase